MSDRSIDASQAAVGGTAGTGGAAGTGGPAVGAAPVAGASGMSVAELIDAGKKASKTGKDDSE
ncbi:MAG: hypothetical protein ABMB14_39975 [Myxococcota bacterium]